jgi:hypothetical protein
VNSRKHRRFSAKSLGPAGFDRLDPGRLDLDPLDLRRLRTCVSQTAEAEGSRSSGEGTHVSARAAAGDGERRRSATSGGALAGETQTRVPGHDLARG